MRCLHVLGVACALDSVSGFGLGGRLDVSHHARSSSRTQSTCTSMVMPDATDISAGAQLLLAYSDEATAAAKSVSGMEQMIGIAGVGTVGLFGVLASALKLPEAGKIELTEAEQDAVTA
ncbi:unnamed protein product, partial [Ectocarpus sp. 6 AP-2014]